MDEEDIVQLLDGLSISVERSKYEIIIMNLCLKYR